MFPLDNLALFAYTINEETYVSVFRAEPLPVIGGGAAHFLYRLTKEGGKIVPLFYQGYYGARGFRKRR